MTNSFGSRSKAGLKGQLEDGMAENDYNTMLANTRERLGQFCKDDGEAMIPIDAHIVTAERN